MKTILLAEDEESSIALFQAMLAQRNDWRLIVARSGQAAVELAQQEHPDLALLDIQLPEISGIEACRQIKSDPSTADTHVIMVSAMSQNTSKSEAKSAGANEFISKPFSTTELTALLEQRLG